MADDYILFDIPEGEEAVDAEFLEGLGHQVMMCHGPSREHSAPSSVARVAHWRRAHMGSCSSWISNVPSTERYWPVTRIRCGPTCPFGGGSTRAGDSTRRIAHRYQGVVPAARGG